MTVFSLKVKFGVMWTVLTHFACADNDLLVLVGLMAYSISEIFVSCD